MQPSGDVDDRHANFCGSALSVTGDAHQSAAGLHGKVVSAFVTTRTVVAVGRDAAHHRPLRPRSKPCIGASWAEIFEDDVSVRHQIAHVLEVLLFSQVPANDLLAEVHRGPVGRDFLVVHLGERWPPASRIVTPWGFYTQHIGTKVLQQFSCIWPCQNTGQVEHLHAFEGSEHGRTLSRGRMKAP